MQRVTAANAVASLPSPAAPEGPPGYFASSNNPLLQTTVTPDWVNNIQEELCAIVVAGGLALNVAINNQVLTAINSLIAQALLSAGFVTGDQINSFVTQAVLNSTLTGYVTTAALASALANYVTQAALNSTLANYVTLPTLNSRLNGYPTLVQLAADLTNYTPLSAFSRTVGGSPFNSYIYHKSADGTIIQANHGGSVTGQDFVQFPNPFPTACIQVVVCEGNPEGWINGTSPTIFGAQQPSPTQFALYVTRLNLTTGAWQLTAGISYRYIAIGY